jgi:hypothetical protein
MRLDDGLRSAARPRKSPEDDRIRAGSPRLRELYMGSDKRP